MCHVGQPVRAGDFDQHLDSVEVLHLRLAHAAAGTAHVGARIVPWQHVARVGAVDRAVLAGVRMRALRIALPLFFNSLIGLELGKQVLGILSDHMRPHVRCEFAVLCAARRARCRERRVRNQLRAGRENLDLRAN